MNKVAVFFCSQPTQQHWTAVKIFRYLRGTTTFGLFYSKESESSALIGYSDAYWGNDCNNTRSVTGYLFQVGGTAVTWRSQKQSCEYMELSSAAWEAIWMRRLNSDLGNLQLEPTLIHEDNQATIAMAKNP